MRTSSALTVAVVAVIVTIPACDSAHVASGARVTTTEARTPSALAALSSERLPPAVQTAVEGICTDAAGREQALPPPPSDAASVTTAVAALRALFDGDGARLLARSAAAHDRPLNAALRSQVHQAHADLDRAARRAAAGDVAAATVAYQDAAGIIEELGSILRHWGATCGDPAQASRSLTVEPTAVIDVGPSDSQVTATPTDVWVSLYDGRSVVRIDPSSDHVVARIPVDDDDLRTIQVTLDGVWVRGATAMHRIDPATNTVTLTIPKSAIGSAVTRAFVDDAAVWACNGPAVVRASKVDGHPEHTTPLPFPCGGVTSDGAGVWATSDQGADGYAAQIDAATGSLVRVVPIPVDPATLPVIAHGMVWTVGQSRPGAVEIDSASGAQVRAVKLPGAAGSGAITATHYYVPVDTPGVVDAIDGGSGTIDTDYDGGAEPNAVSVSGTTMWVADEAEGQVRRFDLS